jgi:hypothetical protein
MAFTNRDAYDTGQRLAQEQPGVEYEDLDITGDAAKLVRQIDETEDDNLAVDMERGFHDARLRTPKYEPPQD